MKFLPATCPRHDQNENKEGYSAQRGSPLNAT